jgi:hypothetical protein
MRKSLFDLGQRLLNGRHGFPQKLTKSLGGLGDSQHLQHTVWRKSLFPLGQRLLNGRQEFAKRHTMLGGLAKRYSSHLQHTVWESTKHRLIEITSEVSNGVKNQTKILKNRLQSQVNLQHTVWESTKHRLIEITSEVSNGVKNLTKIFKNGLQSLKRARKRRSFSPVEQLKKTIGNISQYLLALAGISALMYGLGFGFASNVPDAVIRYQQLELKKIEASEIKQGSKQNNEPTIPADFNTSSPSRTGCNNASQ